MLKTAMLVSALALSAPAFAQEATVSQDGGANAAVAQSAPAAAPADATASTAVQPAAPVTGASQIAQVVNTEFPSYDKNADSNLDKAEFGAWMVALKTASDPSTKAADPATQTWIAGAFASADTDKSAVVSKDELTKYLSQGAE